MVSRPAVKTGELWLVDLDLTVGSEIQKTRPCVVVSPPEMHNYLRTVIVAPMTTGEQPAAFRIGSTFQGKRGLVLLDQIRTLDKIRPPKRMGTIAPVALKAVLTTLQSVFEPAS